MTVASALVPAVGWDDIFSFQDYGELVALLSNSIIAGAVLGIVGGLIGVFVMQRDLAFAVHGVSELSFAGAAAALLFGGSVVFGSL
ncbi:metal ABC transporter permease, partial [Mycobacterium tuberculosis]|uniref:metal ABC transporter permease n=1 Tax=Mycobacterium tuberculosis TaxID=1773 RepID=UPI000AF7AFEE